MTKNKLTDLLDESYTARSRYRELVKPKLYAFLEKEVAKTTKYSAFKALSKDLKKKYGRGYTRHYLAKIYNEAEKEIAQD